MVSASSEAATTVAAALQPTIDRDDVDDEVEEGTICIDRKLSPYLSNNDDNNTKNSTGLEEEDDDLIAAACLTWSYVGPLLVVECDPPIETMI